MGKILRDLTEKEMRGIRRLVTQKCANYDPEYGCLPLDCECVMLGKAYCGNTMVHNWVLLHRQTYREVDSGGFVPHECDTD